MSQASATPVPPSEPAWDIALTRLMNAAQAQVQVCVIKQARRFEAIGLGSDMQVRQTPRGLSTLLALVGQRGLVCIVDFTLVDGLIARQEPGITLDIRLLDACGDVVADAWALHMTCPGHHEILPTTTPLSSDELERAATAVYIVTLAQFDLSQILAHSG